MKPSTQIILLALALITAVYAGPGYGAIADEAVAPALSRCDIVFLLDNSGSMKTGGSSVTIKSLTSSILDSLSDGSRASLIVFANRLDMVLPLRPVREEETRRSITAALDRLDYTGAYSNIPAALERAVYELRANRREDAQRLVVFVTDGNIDSGRPSDDARKQTWMVGELAEEIRELGIRVYSFSTTEEANYELLQVLSHKTDGEYFRVSTPSELQTAANRFCETFARPAPEVNRGSLPEAPTPPKNPQSRAVQGDAGEKPMPSSADTDDQGTGSSQTEPVNEQATTPSRDATGKAADSQKPNPAEPQPDNTACPSSAAPAQAGERVEPPILSQPKAQETNSAPPPRTPEANPQGDSTRPKAPETQNPELASGQNQKENTGNPAIAAAAQSEEGETKSAEKLSEDNPVVTEEQVEPIATWNWASVGDRWFRVVVVAGAGLSGIVALLMALRLVMRTKNTVAASRPLAESAPTAWIPEAFLVDLDNASSALQHPLERPVTHIGRSERNHVRIADLGQTVSSLHATVECRSNGFFLVDRDSLNGTYLDGERLAKYAPVPIKPGDIFVVAKQFRFKLDMPGIEDRGGTVAIQTGDTSRVN